MLTNVTYADVLRPCEKRRAGFYDAALIVGGSFVLGALPFVLVLIVFGLIIYYFFYKKRLEHKQILAAIEKGTPLSELRPAKPTGPAWIKNLTAAIALLIISAGLVCFQFLVIGAGKYRFILIALILFAIGISRLVRGLLQRKTEKAHIQPSGQTEGGENKNAQIQ